jgi:hypothetical protein
MRSKTVAITAATSCDAVSRSSVPSDALTIARKTVPYPAANHTTTAKAATATVHAPPIAVSGLPATLHAIAEAGNPLQIAHND